MWSRRTFLQQSSLALAAMTSIDALGARSGHGPLDRRSACSFIRCAMRSPKTFRGR